MQTILHFTGIVSSHGSVFRASFNDCMLELSPDKKTLQVIAADSQCDLYAVVDGECHFLSSSDEGTVCYLWTANDWSSVEDAIQKA